MCGGFTQLMEALMNGEKSATELPDLPAGKESTVYFYYVNAETGAVNSYEMHDILNGLNDLDKLVPALVRNAVGTRSNPPLFGYDFESLIRCRKGHFLVALDGGTFGGSKDPIEFTLDKWSDDTPVPNPPPNGKHTFEPKGIMTVPLSDRNIEVAVYYDHMKKKTGEWPKKGIAWEHFLINFNDKSRGLLGDGSGGTNMGPPPPPPVPANPPNPVG
jgi:hypothetical protein